MEKEDCGCLYRIGMAYLLGQLGFEIDLNRALSYLELAASRSDLDTPQPGYVLGMVRAGEFEGVQLGRIPVDLEFAKENIERSAFLGFGPAQLKMVSLSYLPPPTKTDNLTTQGQSYELAQLNCPFDPLLSVQYYALASQNGEVDADLGLSKWYLCGSEGHFEKNENLALTFAEKAAKKGLPSAEFAIGYYREVGIGGIRDVAEAMQWYAKVSRSLFAVRLWRIDVVSFVGFCERE